MELNLKRPIIFFDLETTGIDIARDRIVEISMVKVMPDGEENDRPLEIELHPCYALIIIGISSMSVALDCLSS